MPEFVPLLIGDEVRPICGDFAGRAGRVSAIEQDGRCIDVYFGTRREEYVDGSLGIVTDADKFDAADLTFRGQTASQSLFRPAMVASSPPRGPALEAAVLEAIWDDARRSAYADWLEEKRDPHAAYLRVQISLAEAVRAGRSFEPIVDRERRLRAVLNPDWVSRFRRLTTQPPPFDVAALDPAYAAHARTSIRLHPRSGNVSDPAASKVGGLFLWPADEPWPTATNAVVDPDFAQFNGPFPENWSTVPLTPILQLAQRDLPNIPFPSNTDLLQVFWCPFITGLHAPDPFVVWRNSTTVKSPRLEPPIQHSDAAYGTSPTACRIYPEVITEYPDAIEVPENPALDRAVRAWAASWPDPSSAYSYWWNRCTGWKVGGYPWVNQSDCVRVEQLAPDGRQMEYLLQVSEREVDHCNWRWTPIEDRNLCFTGARVGDELDLHVLSRGDYHLLFDRRTSPWLVRSFHDSAG